MACVFISCQFICIYWLIRYLSRPWAKANFRDLPVYSDSALTGELGSLATVLVESSQTGRMQRTI